MPVIFAVAVVAGCFLCQNVKAQALTLPPPLTQELAASEQSGGAPASSAQGHACDEPSGPITVANQDFFDCLDEQFKSTRAEGGRWFLAEYDWDNRGYNVLHVMGHSPLPLGFSLWGFIDLEGAEGTVADREDISRHFLELDLKRKVFGNWGVIGELNDIQGQDNEIGRFGVFWQPDTSDWAPQEGLLAGKFKLGFKYFVLETDRRGGQWSFNWNKQFSEIVDGRISAGGFFDLNYDTGPLGNEIRLVTEHQVRFRLAEGLHLITEFRLNEYLLGDQFGIAPGLQYRF